MIEIEANIQGRRYTGDRAMRELEKRLRPPNEGAQKLLEKISQDFTAVQRLVFARGGATSERGPWKRLKQSTIRRRGGSSLVHIDKGRLRRSLTDTGHSDFYSFIRLRRTGPEVEIGTTTPYSPYVDKRRRLIRYTSKDVKRWAGMLAKFFAKT